jgi:hypothetical protein
MKRTNRKWWIVAAAIAVGIASVSFGPAAAEESAKAAAEGGAEGEGLVVEQVLRKQGQDGQPVVEVRFKLIGVEELPKHPSITYLVDEETGKLVRLQRAVMLPPTSHDPATAKTATMALPDPDGVIRPGTEVTVVVAGLIREGVVVEGLGPGEMDGKVAAATEKVNPDARLEIVKLRIAGDGSLVDLRYRLHGVSRVKADEGDSYIEHPESGERLYVLGVARIGTLATKDTGSDKTSFVLFKNSQKTVKGGDKVRVVIAGVAQDDVLVEE